MSLFGKADAGLPLLTQFYQAEGPQTPYEGMLMPVEKIRDSEIYTFLLRGTEEEVAADPFEQLEDKEHFVQGFPEFHDAVQKLMDALADDSTMYGGLVSVVNEWINRFGGYSTTIKIAASAIVPQYMHTAELLLHQKEGDIDISDIENPLTIEQVPASKLRLVPNTPSTNITLLKLVRELQGLLSNEAKGPTTVRRCAECNNPFIVLRTDHVYCSYRDAHRAGQRRRRKLIEFVGADLLAGREPDLKGATESDFDAPD